MTPRWPFLAVVAAAGAFTWTSSDGAPGSRPAPPPASEAVAGLTAPAAQPAESPGSTWYCAGGETVVLANITDRPVTGTVTVQPGELAAPPAPAGGPTGAGDPAPEGDTSTGPEPEPAQAQAPVERAVTVPAHDRIRVVLAEVMPPAGERPAPGGAVVELDGGGVAVEQEVGQEHGLEVAPCASATAPEWHFAWGRTTRDARELLVLFNPFPSDVAVDGSFVTEGGPREPVRWQGLVVPAHRTVTVDLGQDVTRREHVSATLRSRGGGFVASRVLSFDGSDGRAGTSLALGQPRASTSWTFAYGEVDDRSGERIVLYNPGRAVAEVDVTVGAAQPFGVVVRPGQFEAVDYGGEARVEPSTPHATVVRSRNGVPVVAERVLTVGGSRGGRGPAVSGEVAAGPGTPVAQRAWLLTALPLRGPEGPDQARLAVVNPDPTRPARVWVTVEQNGVRSQPGDLQGTEVAPGSRADLVLPPQTGTVGVLLQSDQPVVVERVVVRDGRVTSVAPGLPLG